MDQTFRAMVNLQPSPIFSSIYEGDLIIGGNTNYTIMDQLFEINGSIIVEGNATLFLKNATIDIIQSYSHQHNMTFRNPSNGNPRLQALNATIASSYAFVLYFYGNSTATVREASLYDGGWHGTDAFLIVHESSIINIFNSHIPCFYTYDSSVVNIFNSSTWEFRAHGSSVVNVFNSYMGDGLYAYGSSTVNISNSTVGGHGFDAYDSSQANISDSAIYYLFARDSSFVDVSYSAIDWVYTFNSCVVFVSNSRIVYGLLFSVSSVNGSVADLAPGFFSFWSNWLNLSIVGYASSVTVTDTQIQGWSFQFQGLSNVTIFNSSIIQLSVYDSSVVAIFKSKANLIIYDSSIVDVFNSEIEYLYAHDSSISNISNTEIQRLFTYRSSIVRLVNSTVTYRPEIHDYSKVYVCWYLDVHVVNLIGQPVPSANVTAKYLNATVADSGLTESDGWARLTLVEKIMTSEGNYPSRNYIVVATYEDHAGREYVRMNRNKRVTIHLPFIAP